MSQTKNRTSLPSHRQPADTLFVITAKVVERKVKIIKRTHFSSPIRIGEGSGVGSLQGNPKIRMLNIAKRTQFPSFSGEFRGCVQKPRASVLSVVLTRQLAMKLAGVRCGHLTPHKTIMAPCTAALPRLTLPESVSQTGLRDCVYIRSASMPPFAFPGTSAAAAEPPPVF